MNAALYCRVSTEEQAKEGFSIQAQKNTLKAYCNLKGWDITGVYTDEGISGKSMERPAFKSMLKDAKNKLFDVVLVWKINRFSRKNADLLNTVEYLNRCGVNLVSCSEQFDASTPSGRLMLSMLGSIGEFERDTIVENIKAGMDERARQGLYNGGRVLGYDSLDGQLVINEREAFTVKRIYTLFLSGCSMGRIRKTLAGEELSTKNGYEFEISSIRRILKNPLYAGYIGYTGSYKKNSINYKGKHQPLISQNEFDTVQQMLNLRVHKHIRSNHYILSGLIMCPVCGNIMTGHSTKNRYRYYVCSRYKKGGRAYCSGKIINAGLIENRVADIICSIASSNTVIQDVYSRVIEMHNNYSSTQPFSMELLKKELGRNMNTKNRYINLFESGAVNQELFISRMNKIDGEIRRIENTIDILNDSITSSIPVSYDCISNLLRNFKKIYISLDSLDKKRLISSVISNIHVTTEGEIELITYKFPNFAESVTAYTLCHISQITAVMNSASIAYPSILNIFSRLQHIIIL